MRWLFIGALGLHGVIHTIGFVGAADIAEIEGLAGEPHFFGGVADNGTMMGLLAFLWLAIAIAFVTAAVGFALQKDWAMDTALIASLISLALCVTWWGDAWAGALISAALAALFAFAPDWVEDAVAT
jgi:hypothetical protein